MRTYRGGGDVVFPPVRSGSRSALTKGADSGKIKEKSHNKITPITDKAIEKVKRVEIDGFTDKQNDYIHNQHKELLKYARDNNENKEVAFVFRKDLSDKTIFKGNNDTVDFGNALLSKGDGLFVMHNHPNNSSFSNTDLRFVISDDNVNTLTIVKNNGFVEMLTKSDDYNVQKVKVYLKRAYKKYVFDELNDEQIDNAIRYFLNHNGGNFKWIK